MPCSSNTGHRAARNADRAQFDMPVAHSPALLSVWPSIDQRKIGIQQHAGHRRDDVAAPQAAALRRRAPNRKVASRSTVSPSAPSVTTGLAFPGQRRQAPDESSSVSRVSCAPRVSCSFCCGTCLHAPDRVRICSALALIGGGQLNEAAHRRAPKRHCSATALSTRYLPSLTCEMAYMTTKKANSKVTRSAYEISQRS
jgi:hypothetical protein